MSPWLWINRSKRSSWVNVDGTQLLTLWAIRILPVKFVTLQSVQTSIVLVQYWLRIVDIQGDFHLRWFDDDKQVASWKQWTLCSFAPPAEMASPDFLPSLLEYDITQATEVSQLMTPTSHSSSYHILHGPVTPAGVCAVSINSQSRATQLSPARSGTQSHVYVQNWPDLFFSKSYIDG